MEYMWTTAGGIVGWIIVEFVSAATKTVMPGAFNIGMAFVGGLVGYHFSM